jgi:hypothetical protein
VRALHALPAQGTVLVSRQVQAASQWGTGWRCSAQEKGFAWTCVLNLCRHQQLYVQAGALRRCSSPSQVFALEGENKRLARALVREVGEDVPLAKVLEEGSDWKGRRETIIALRDTIRKMREDMVRATLTSC